MERNKLENKKAIEKINKKKSYLFQKYQQDDKPLARLTKRKRWLKLKNQK